MDEKITIIEGPPPIFEQVSDGWAMGLNESPNELVPALHAFANVQRQCARGTLPPRLEQQTAHPFTLSQRDGIRGNRADPGGS